MNRCKYIKTYSRDLEKEETNVFKKFFKYIKKKRFLREQYKTLKIIEKEREAIMSNIYFKDILVDPYEQYEAIYWEHEIDMLDFERDLILRSIERLK